MRRACNCLVATIPRSAAYRGAKTCPADSAIGDDRTYVKFLAQGQSELSDGKVQEAISALERAVHLNPRSFEAHLWLGTAFERAGKFEAARAAYSFALNLDLTSAEARDALSRLPSAPPLQKDFRVGQVLWSTTTDCMWKVLEVKRGGFGAVYVVRDQLGSLNALKTFQARYLWSDPDRKRFEQEAVTWVLLDRHPHIVSALWAERIRGFPCLVLEVFAKRRLGPIA